MQEELINAISEKSQNALEKGGLTADQVKLAKDFAENPLMLSEVYGNLAETFSLFQLESAQNPCASASEGQSFALTGPVLTAM